VNTEHIRIAVLPGDGIGVDVMHAALPILQLMNLPLKITFGDIGWKCWQQEGNPIPSRTWELIEQSDVTLLGAITSKPEREALLELSASCKGDILYTSPIIQLRQAYDLYANIRPCYNINGKGKDFNFCVIRENTEGLYAGFDFYPLPEQIHAMMGKSQKWSAAAADEITCTLRLHSKKGWLRIFEYAFAYAERHRMQRVTFADKPNVLRNSSAFAREIFESVAERYSNITADILNVDAVALWLIKRPEEFGVIVAENMFGDILSDVGAAVMGGLGFAPSANIGGSGCYFEPVHGSGPRLKKNSANPSAMFLTISMMLDYLGLFHEAERIRRSVTVILQQKQSVTYDGGGRSTTHEMAQAILQQYTRLE
jgi:isocitrate/isopropylmalate dehydrogenase